MMASVHRGCLTAKHLNGTPAKCATHTCRRVSRSGRVIVQAANGLVVAEAQLSGFMFDTASAELAKIDSTNAELDTLARSGFHPDCEAAINQQINIEYNISYVYHTLFAYFDRDNVALRGIAKYFKESSAEEREHAELLMQYNSKRGGRVVLQSLITPQSEFNHAEKGDALYAFELALSLEKLNFAKLRELHDVALTNNDAPLVHFVKNQLLADQADSVKKVSEFVSQLRRVDKGLGVFEFDARLSKMA